MTRLRQKAADRNKDEFYFGMNKEKTKVRCGVLSERYVSNELGREACISRKGEMRPFL